MSGKISHHKKELKMSERMKKKYNEGAFFLCVLGIRKHIGNGEGAEFHAQYNEFDVMTLFNSYSPRKNK